MKEKFLITTILLFSLILVPSMGSASSISITTNHSTGDIMLSWDGFTYSFTVNGVVPGLPNTVESGSVTDSTGNPNMITFGGFFESVGGSNWVNNGNATIGFRRADNTLSDFLFVGFYYRGTEIPLPSGNPTNMVSGHFVSAINDAVLTDAYINSIGGPPLVYLPAGGTNIEVSSYLWGDRGRPYQLPPGFDSFKVSWDSGTTSVPEPTTMLLLGLGLVGLAGVRRKLEGKK
jgi:hypothetical protein